MVATLAVPATAAATDAPQVNNRPSSVGPAAVERDAADVTVIEVPLRDRNALLLASRMAASRIAA